MAWRTSGKSEKDHAVIDAFIRQPPPRNVPKAAFRAAGGTASKALMLEAGIAVLFVFLFISWYFQADEILVDIWLNSSHETTSDGLLESWEYTDTFWGTPKTGFRDKPSPIYRLYFSYDTPQGKQMGQSYVTGLDAIPGIETLSTDRQSYAEAEAKWKGNIVSIKMPKPFPVTVEYHPGRPSWSRVQATRFSQYDTGVFWAVGASFGLAIPFLLYGIFRSRRLKRLLAEGLKGHGHIVEVRHSKVIVSVTHQDGMSRTIHLPSMPPESVETCRNWLAANTAFEIWYLPGCSDIVIPELLKKG